MVKAKVIILLLLTTVLTVHAQEYEWSSVKIDGSRTGCASLASGELEKTLGRFREDGSYESPGGKVFSSHSTVAKVASIVNAAQPKMAKVKTVIGYSEKEMQTVKYESELSNWFVNIVMNKVEALSGKKVDVGICNFGGIRVNMPQGNVILDDILSMFPFKNELVYLELKGSRLRNIFETMASTRFQAIGGVEIIVEGGKLTKALIGGEPIDDDKLYGVATISFLLYGGDSLTLSEGAVDMTIFDVPIVEAVLEYLASLKEQGKNIVPPSVTYVTIK